MRAVIPGQDPELGTDPNSRMDFSRHLCKETITLGDHGQAHLVLVPVGKLDPSLLTGSLTPREQSRAASLQSPARFAEYVTSRWLLRQLPDSCSGQGMRPTTESDFVPGPLTISHCRRWIAAACSVCGTLGLDVESRLPRQLPEVVQRLGWGALDTTGYLQAWSLWEAWRKLAGGSVLDEPDAVYAAVLASAGSLFEAPQQIADITWWSLQLEGACLSLAWRP